jgi:hypothetical protein
MMRYGQSVILARLRAKHTKRFKSGTKTVPYPQHMNLTSTAVKVSGISSCELVERYKA